MSPAANSGAITDDGSKFALYHSSVSPYRYFQSYTVPASRVYTIAKLDKPRPVPPISEAFIGFMDEDGLDTETKSLTTILITRDAYLGDVD